MIALRIGFDEQLPIGGEFGSEQVKDLEFGIRERSPQLFNNLPSEKVNKRFNRIVEADKHQPEQLLGSHRLQRNLFWLESTRGIAIVLRDGDALPTAVI